MTTTKMTYVNAINHAIESLSGKSMDETTRIQSIEKLIALSQQLEKRNASKSGKPTKKQAENSEVKDTILSKLSSTEGKQCGTIAAEIGISGQKCSALLTQLVKTGEVIKTEGVKIEGVKGKVTLFFLPTGG